MGDMIPARRARGPNEPGGMSFGHMADCIQTLRKKPDEKEEAVLQVATASSMLYDQIWLGGYMSGGVGFTMYATPAYTNNVLEDHFGGSQRATTVALTSAGAVGLATGNAQAALSGWYLSMYLHKEAHGRLGFYGYDLQDQCGATNVFSLASDEGCQAELRGANYPNYAMNVGHQGGYTSGCVASAHAGRGDAFCVNPL